VVSGFLGSGKTTLVRELLADAQRTAVKAAVVSNEFGELGIDRALLGKLGDGYVELEGGCVCCRLSDELVETLQTLWERVQPDRVIIETSGVALPYDVQINFWREPVSQWVEDDVAVVIVNAEQLLEGRDLDATFEQQVSSADFLLLNKIDLVPESASIPPCCFRRIPMVCAPAAATQAPVRRPITTSTSPAPSSGSKPASIPKTCWNACAPPAPCEPRASWTPRTACTWFKAWELASSSPRSTPPPRRRSSAASFSSTAPERSNPASATHRAKLPPARLSEWGKQMQASLAACRNRAPGNLRPRRGEPAHRSPRGSRRAERETWTGSSASSSTGSPTSASSPTPPRRRRSSSSCPTAM
jgi:Ni2+-binding GTPase involved in maturation of urease and hydrogenase